MTHADSRADSGPPSGLRSPQEHGARAATPSPGHPASATPHRWQFFRSGGFDQVRIESVADLRHLRALDQKLWAVLACPVEGLEFDARTLRLIDASGEGRVGTPEMLEAVDWACRMLADPQILFTPGDALPLDLIATDHDEGRQVLAAARQVLATLGKPQAQSITVADLSEPARLFDPRHPNGDGIVPAEMADDPVLADAVAAIAEALGPATDRSGRPGIDRARLDRFLTEAREVLDWKSQAAQPGSAALPLGDETASAAAALDAVRAKVDDWFTRCRLAAYDTRAAEALNPDEQAYADLAGQTLAASDSGIAALPLARVVGEGALPLRAGLNPAWEAPIAQLRDRVVTPMLGAVDALSAAQWQDLCGRLEAWRHWNSARPASTLTALPTESLQALTDPALTTGLLALIERDLDAATATAHIDALERLARYRRDLVTLLRNFVNLADFYTPGGRAIFQAGTLYIDQRSCDLCLRVTDMSRHASLAPLSGTFLLYCHCTRQGEAPITVVAALTAGDADDMLVAGRNGVFHDRQGREWHASVTRIVAHPISVRQAFWMPYKRLGRMVSDQVQRYASAQDKAVEGRTAAGIADASRSATAPAPAPAAQPFDIARFAGIFAAIGLALGALGTALAAFISGFLALPAWKMPLVLAGVVLLISGPSMLLAWFKLRQRNLGPLLDANGWAVNTRARINIAFGSALTHVASLPPGARRTLNDPYADKPPAWGRWAIAAAALLALWWWLLWSGAL